MTLTQASTWAHLADLLVGIRMTRQRASFERWCVAPFGQVAQAARAALKWPGRACRLRGPVLVLSVVVLGEQDVLR